MQETEINQALDGTTFPEGLKPFFVYNFCRCVCNNRDIVQACGGVCGGGVGGVGSGSDGFWGHLRMHLPMRGGMFNVNKIKVSVKLYVHVFFLIL